MSGQVVQTRPTIGFAFEQLTVADSVQVLTPAKYKDSATSGGASACFISTETGSIRYTYDSVTTPTTTVGHLLAAGGTLVLLGQNQMSNFKCIRATGTSAVLTATYERE